MKSTRHRKILELIEEHEIETQEELAKWLNQAGYQVTQATVSRDIRQLQLTKIATKDGKQKYTVIETKEKAMDDRHYRILHDCILSIEIAMNQLVIKTSTGMAMAVGAALDAMELEEMMGCIAGDDTILCIAKNEKNALKLLERLKIAMQ